MTLGINNRKDRYLNFKATRFGRPVLHPEEMFENFVITAAIFMLVSLVTLFSLSIVKTVWPSLVPYTLFELWQPKGSLADALWESKWLFAWALSLVSLSHFAARNPFWLNRTAEKNFAKNSFVSVLAGVGEEIGFRWLAFMWAIVGLKISNFLLLGFIGWGLPEHFQAWVAGPFTNLVTFGVLHEQMSNAPWYIGAAILVANAKFRDGHKYQGWFGLFNSWFIGMFLFHLMFTYGLVAAIVVHFVYDFLFDVVRYIDQVVERAQGNG